MGESTGREGAIFLGANPVASINGFNITEQIATIPVMKMGQTHEEFKAGLASWNGDMTLYWDPDDTQGQGAITVGAELTGAFYPFGNSSGKVFKTGTVLIESVGDEVPADGMVQKKVNFKGVGALNEETVP